MAQRKQDELPAELIRVFERKGEWIRASKAVRLDADDPDHVALFHLGGVKELLNEALDTIATCQVILSNPDAIPLEQPANVILAPPIAFPSIHPSVEGGFLSNIETWADARERLHQLVKRMAFGHALSKFFAAMPNPEGGSKWSHKLTQHWLEENEDMAPVYTKYKNIRNSQESHRAKTRTEADG